MNRRNLILKFGLFASLLSVTADGQTPPSSGTACQNIVVMTCNVRTPHDVDLKAGDGWQDRKDLCIDAIRKQHPDIIGFQECAKIQFNDLHAAFPDYATYSLNGESPLSDDPFEVIFVSPRFSVAGAAGYWLSETPNVPGSMSWDNSKHPRVLNWMRLIDKDSGVQLRILNTHLDHKGKKAREQSARLINADAKAFPADFPQILTGDLNVDATSPAIAALKQGGWIDTYTQVNGPQEPGYTAHDFLGERFAGTPRDNKGRIDWIFYRGSVKPLSSSVLRDHRGDHYPSDHYFVIAEIQVTAASAPASSSAGKDAGF